MAYFDCIVGGSGKGNTLVVTCADDLAGATITCTNGTKTYNKTCPSTSPYEVTFYGLEAGTWTVSATVSGNTYTATVVVVDCTALLGGFNWRTWVDTAQFLDSTDYDSLSEVLADELALRELALEHACVDYLANIATVSADVETIIENDLFAKWVNNSDYALDFLGANTVIKALMDEADKYFYGEWVITDDTTTPPTWGPKGNVPVMTSDTAPYGKASASTYTGTFRAYKAFNGVINPQSEDGWITGSSSFPQWLQYEFVNPICAKRAKLIFNQYNTSATVKISASNDGTTFTDIVSGITVNGTEEKSISMVDNDNYYRIYRLTITAQTRNTSSSIGQIVALQFYGRELSVSVPVMTGNAAPYGEASATSVYSYGGTSYPAHLAFDGNDSTRWIGTSYPNTIYYEFPSQVKICMFTYMGDSADNLGKDIALVDGNSNDAVIESYTTENTANIQAFTVSNPIETSKYGLKITNVWGSASNSVAKTLQFYGKDYSEKEFEEGTTKKWLYDHGVELVDIYTAKTGSAVVTKEENAIYMKTVNGQMAVCSNNEAIDLTGYNLVRAKNEPMVTTYSTPVYAQIFIHPNKATSTSDYSSNYVAVSNFTNEIINTFGLDISAINTAEYIQYGFYGGNSYTENRFKELWLE